MKIKYIAIAAISSLFISTASFAASFDFSGVNTADEGFINSTSDGDLTISFSATPYGVEAYQDSTIAAGKAYITSDNNAGLGVCAVNSSDADSCDRAGRDGIDAGESLILTFSRMVRLNSLGFNEAPHHYGAINPGNDIEIFIDGVGGYTYASALGILGTTFEFANSAKQSYYLASLSTVPVPAAGLLMGSALLGMLGYTRRKARIKKI